MVPAPIVPFLASNPGVPTESMVTSIVGAQAANYASLMWLSSVSTRKKGRMQSRQVSRLDVLWLGSFANLHAEPSTTCQRGVSSAEPGPRSLCGLRRMLPSPTRHEHLLTRRLQITIEDCDVSLWYFCRSHTAKSEPFNFLEVSLRCFPIIAKCIECAPCGRIQPFWSKCSSPSCLPTQSP